MSISRSGQCKEGKREIMERSFVNKYGKWIALAVVVLALGLWFYLSNGTEN